jgi:Tfp pilus assembly protein PilX
MIKIFKKIKNLKFKNQKKGVALVIALTVVSLLLSLTVSMSNIILRQTRITNVTNESKPAFYIADSAMECAVYYDTLAIFDGGININKDFNQSIFGKTTAADATSKIKCGPSGGRPIGLTKSINADASIVTTEFDIDYGDNKCAKVQVERGKINTKIITRGYNTGVTINGCDLSNINKKRLVERGLITTY